MAGLHRDATPAHLFSLIFRGVWSLRNVEVKGYVCVSKVCIFERLQGLQRSLAQWCLSMSVMFNIYARHIHPARPICLG